MSTLEHSSVVRWVYQHPFKFWSFMLCLLLVLKWGVFNIATKPDTASLTTVHEAAKVGDLNTISEALKINPLVDYRDNCEWTALMHAAQNGHFEATALLLKSGADVNAVDKGGYSVLTITAIFSNPQILQLLVDSGARINFQDPEMGWTALIWSAKEGHVNNVSVLINAGANTMLKDKAGKTALAWAIARNHSEIVMLLKPVS